MSIGIQAADVVFLTHRRRRLRLRRLQHLHPHQLQHLCLTHVHQHNIGIQDSRSVFSNIILQALDQDQARIQAQDLDHVVHTRDGMDTGAYLQDLQLHIQDLDRIQAQEVIHVIVALHTNGTTGSDDVFPTSNIPRDTIPSIPTSIRIAGPLATSTTHTRTVGIDQTDTSSLHSAKTGSSVDGQIRPGSMQSTMQSTKNSSDKLDQDIAACSHQPTTTG